MSGLLNNGFFHIGGLYNRLYRLRFGLRNWSWLNNGCCNFHNRFFNWLNNRLFDGLNLNSFVGSAIAKTVKFRQATCDFVLLVKSANDFAFAWRLSTKQLGAIANWCNISSAIYKATHNVALILPLSQEFFAISATLLSKFVVSTATSARLASPICVYVAILLETLEVGVEGGLLDFVLTLRSIFDAFCKLVAVHIFVVQRTQNDCFDISFEECKIASHGKQPPCTLIISHSANYCQ